MLCLKGDSKRSRRDFNLLALLFCIAIFLLQSTTGKAGSARDYLTAPIDSWLKTCNASYLMSVTLEDGTGTQPGSRSNAFIQSLVVTRTMDLAARAGGLSVVLPYAFLHTKSGLFQASTNGVSDVGLLWQINIFGDPALTGEEITQ